MLYPVLEGETSSSFPTSESGEYALIISSEMCSDTSECISVMLTSGIHNLVNHVSTIYPNPASEWIEINISGNLDLSSIRIFDTLGKLKTLQNASMQRIDVRDFVPGIHYVELLYKNGYSEVLKFVKL